jgi:cell wall-associated NlpC family hydrolase
MKILGSLTLAIRIAVLVITAATLNHTASAQTAYYGAAYRAVPATMQRQAAPAGYGYRPAPRVAAYAAPRAMPVAYVARPVQPTYTVRRAVPVAMPAPLAAAPAPSAAPTGYLDFNGRFASAPSYMPSPVRVAVSAGNNLQNKPYVRGGGHARVDDNAYDCSGSVSYCLIKAGLLARPMSSSEFARYGEAGPGRFITIYVKPGSHVFMSICGLRLDTSGSIEGEGPRWRAKARSMAGFIMRHPFGL